MSKYHIGIMTGTSADAIDGCIVSFENDFSLIASDSIDHEHGYKDNYEYCIAQGLKEVHQSKKLEKLENDLNEKSLEPPVKLAFRLNEFSDIPVSIFIIVTLAFNSV